MRRVLALATLVPLLTVSAVFAQHGGGHASGGGHAGMSSHSGGFAGHSYGSGFSGAHSNFSGHASGVYSYSGPLSSRAYSHPGTGLRNRPYGYRNCYGRGCAYGYGYGYGYSPWWYAGAIDPYWWWDSGSSYDPEQQYETGLANEMNEQSREEQQMREQREQEQQEMQNSYARSAPRSPRAQEASESVPNTVLIFRDQHKEEVQNYAIVGQTLWNFAPQHTQKIPLADLDISATEKANDDRGVDFHVPGSPEGQ